MTAQANIDPANLHRAPARELFEHYGDEATRAKLDQLDRTLSLRPQEIDPELHDDFAAMQVEKGEEFRSFAFGHAVQLYGPANPDFFEATVLEMDAREEPAAG